MPTLDFDKLRADLIKRRQEREAEITNAVLPDGSKFIKDPNNPRKFLRVQVPTETEQLSDSFKIQSQASEAELDPLKKRKLELEVQKAEEEATASELPKLSSGERTSLTATDTALAKIKEIRGLVDNKKADTGGSVLVRNLLQKAGIRIPVANETIDLTSKLSELSAEYAKVLSGAAISDKEFENRLKPFLPQPTDTKQQIKQKLNNLEKTIATRQQSIQERAKTTGLTQGDEIDSFLNSIGQ